MKKRWLGGSFFGLSVVLLLTGSVALAQGGVIYSSWSDQPVTMDGQIGAGEWIDATVLNITCQGTQPVMAYVKNDAYYLYLAVDDHNDTVDVEWGSEMGIYFDDEPPGAHDGTWNSTTCDPYPGEGNMAVASPHRCGTVCTGFFGMVAGTWGPTMCPAGLIPAPGVSGAVSWASGHAQWEMRTNLTTSELRASPGQIIGFYLYSLDVDSLWPGIANGEWPCGLYAADTYEDPAHYGDLVLASGAGPSDIVTEARLDIGMPYNANRGCPSPYTGCGGRHHGFYAGVCTDLAMDAYNAGVPLNIQNALYQDHLAHPGRYRYATARNAEDMRRYFNHNEQFLPHGQAYQPGDIAFFDWTGDGLTNHVNVISVVDTNGRPLKMVDATGVYSGNPTGRALEHSWSSYYDQHIQAHGRLGGGPGAPLALAAEALQVLSITVDSPSVELRLQDGNGKSVSDTYDENLVASNIEAFIPYIPGGTYTDLIPGAVISVTWPLSNTTLYLVEVTGEAATQYHASLHTVQDGGVTASEYFTETITLGETHGITIELQAPGGVITFTASTPTLLPKVDTSSSELELTGLAGMSAQAAFTVTETSNQQALNGVSVDISDLVSQAGQVVSGASFTVTPGASDIPAGGSQSLQVEIALGGIQPGLYQGGLIITTAGSGTRSIPLSLTVRPHHVFMPLSLRNGG